MFCGAARVRPPTAVISRPPSFTIPWRVALTAVVIVVAGLIAFVGLSFGLLTIAALMLLATIWLVWSSVQSLTGEAEMSLDEALALAAPSAEEERKRAVLRALKDLEYERSVGKIGDEDYAELTARYRGEAKALLRALEAHDGPARSRAERLVARRIMKAGILPVVELQTEEPAATSIEPADDEHEDEDEPKAEAHDDESESDDEPESGVEEEDDVDVDAAPPVEARRPTRRCPDCDARNDLDAQFCKKCGEAMADEHQRLCSACPRVYADSEESCPECGVPFDAS